MIKQLKTDNMKNINLFDEFIKKYPANEETKELIINFIDSLAIVLEATTGPLAGMSIEQLKKVTKEAFPSTDLPDKFFDLFIKLALLKNEQNALTLLGLQMGKIYSTTAYGNKPRQVGVYDRGKIYSTTAYGNNPREVGHIEGNQNYSGRGWELKKTCGDLGSGKIYSKTNDFARSYKNQVGYFEAGKIYSGKKESMSLLKDQVGYFEAGKIYRGTGNSASQVGIYDGGYSTGVAAAFFLIL